MVWLFTGGWPEAPPTCTSVPLEIRVAVNTLTVAFPLLTFTVWLSGLNVYALLLGVTVYVPFAMFVKL